MRLRATLVVALLFGALPVTSGAFTSVACASEGARAVLVVDTGGGSHRYCVALSRSQVTGIDLIKLANAQHGLQYKLGFGGNAVCQLAGVGPDGDDCFADDPYFWGYWRGDGSGGWTWSSTGAGSTAVKDGSVEGWSWGTGRDRNSHPKPPPTTFGSVCPPAPKAATGGSKAAAPSSGSGEGARSGAARPRSTSGERDEPPKGNEKKRSRTGRAPETLMLAARADGTRSPGAAWTASEPTGALGAPTGTGKAGPPRAGLAGLGLAALLGLLGVRRARRRGAAG